jgi:hypothetical protein
LIDRRLQSARVNSVDKIYPHSFELTQPQR